jgi:sorbitol-specific phosphotransferase system component IIC
MKRKHLNEYGLVPMLIAILIVVAAVIYFVYTRVIHAQG